MTMETNRVEANRMVDRTGRDTVQYFINLWAAIRSPLRYASFWIGYE
jgi:hypothetical protein